MRFPSMMFGLILSVFSNFGYAAAIQQIKLTDGSIINAEVISMHKGVYILKSPSLGEFSVDAAQIQSISSSNISIPQTGKANLQLNQFQSKLKANPKTMKLISGLQNDPEIQAVLSDPKIMNSIKNGDYAALANNPKFQKLMNNPTVKRIANGVTQ